MLNKIRLGVLVSIFSMILVMSVVAVHTDYKPLTSVTYFSCKETDSGADAYTKGTVVVTDSYDNSEDRTDRCSDFQTLVEFSCENQYPLTGGSKRCKFRCVEGACVDNFASIIKKFSGYSRNVPSGEQEKKEFERSSDYAAKPKASAKAIEVASPRSAVGKYSTQLVCSDTDMGPDTGKKGKLTLEYPSTTRVYEYEDRCKDYKYVLEYDCNNKYPATPTIARCDYRCVDGACQSSFATIVTPRYITRAS